MERVLLGRRWRKPPCYVLLLLLPCGLFAQAPSIRYDAYRIFTKDSLAAPLYPVNSGGAVPHYLYGATTTLAGNGEPGYRDGSGIEALFNFPSAVAIDSKGDLFVADEKNNLIRKVTLAGVVSTFAGTGHSGAANNPDGRQASFNGPCGIAIDAQDNLYVTDCYNHQIRKITSTGIVTTYAGSGAPGMINGAAHEARFSYPVSVAVDSSGIVYVSDQGNNRIRKIEGGTVTSFAGSGVEGFANSRTGAQAQFHQPAGIANDMLGNVYVADQLNHSIRKITPAGVVTTVAGTGLAGSVNNTNALSASFNNPMGITVDEAGNIYVADAGNEQIRKITPNGNVSAFAGSGAPGNVNNSNGQQAAFYFPNDVVTDHQGNVYVADCLNHCIRHIEGTGYSVSPDILPQGLEFDRKTGVFSGRPTELSPGEMHTVTAYNQHGSSSVQLGLAVSSQPGNALAIDDFDDIVTIPDAPSLHAPAFTVEMWVKCRNNKEGRFLVKRNNKYQFDESFAIGVDSSQHFRATMSSGEGIKSSQRFTLQPATLELDHWYYLAGVFAPDSMRLYVDGVFQSAVATGFPVADGINSMTIGFDQRMSFEIDEVRIFRGNQKDRILPDMTNTILPSTAGLVAYYNFNLGRAGRDNGEYVTLYDLSPHANHGKLHNLSLSGSTSNWVTSFAMVVPQAREAMEVEAHQFTARWESSLFGDAGRYLVDVATDALFLQCLPGFRGIEVKALSRIVTGLQPATTYYYRVRCENETMRGEGAYSRTITVTTKN